MYLLFFVEGSVRNVESVCWGTYCFQPPKFLFQWNLPSRSVFPCNIGFFPLKLAGVAKKTPPSLLEPLKSGLGPNKYPRDIMVYIGVNQ